MKCYPFYPIKVRIREMLEPIAGRPAPSKKGDRDSGIAEAEERREGVEQYQGTKKRGVRGGGEVELARKNQ